MSIITNFESGTTSIFHEIDDDIHTVVKAISTVPDKAENVVNKVIQTGGNIVNNAVDKGSSIIKGAEFTLVLPLIFLAGGIGIMFAFSKSSTLESVGVAAANRR